MSQPKVNDTSEDIYTKEARARAQEWADLFRKGTYFLDDEDVMDVLEYMAAIVKKRQEERTKEAFAKLDKLMEIKRDKYGNISRKSTV